MAKNVPPFKAIAAKQRKTSSRLIKQGLLLSPLFFGNAYANEAPVYKFNLPAQPMSATLDSVAKSSATKLMYADATVKGLTAAPVKGSYTAQQALDIALGKSGLQYKVVDNTLITVAAGSSAATAGAVSAASAAEATLKPMTVVADSQPDGDTNPESYRVLDSSASTKTDTPLMATPQSIEVIKRSVIDDQQNINVSESLRNVSGVIPTLPLLTPASDATRIRGFRSEQLIDGFTQYYNPGDRESTINVERLEVLKGSNGVLYSGGSGSPVGGVVNIVSKLPQAQAFGELGFKIGTNDYYQPFIDINQPLHDNVLFRFTGEYTNASSFIDTVNTKRYNLNPSITFTNNEDTSLTLQGKISRWEQPEYQGLPATGTVVGNFNIHRKTFVGPSDIPDSSSENNAVWATFDHTFNNVWSVNVKARYSNSQFDEKVQTLYGADGFTADLPFTLLGPSTWLLANAELFQEQEELSFTGNATAKFDVGPTKNTVLFGADHSQFNDNGYIDADFGSGFGVGSVDMKNPKFNVPFTQPGLGVNNQFVDNLTYGGFGQLQSTLYDRFHLLTSVRIGHVGIDYQSLGKDYDTGKTKVLPRVGGVVDITDEFSLFMNYSQGMRGQPFVTFLDQPAPEESSTLEGGLKFDVAHQLTGQLAGYQIDRDHVAVSNGGLASTATGKQRSVGFEADVVWQASEALSFLANYAHTDAEFSDNKTTGVDAGNKLALVPQNSGRLWANYRFQQDWLKGFSIGGGLYAQSEAFLSNNNDFKSDGYHTFDASLSYEQKHFKLAATVKNITDEEYYQASGYFDGRVAPSQGTSAYFTASVKY